MNDIIITSNDNVKKLGRPRIYKTEEELKQHKREYNKQPELVKRKAENLIRWRNENREKTRAYGRKYHHQKKGVIE